MQVEEGCQLTSVDDIAAAAHHMLRIIEDEAALCWANPGFPNIPLELRRDHRNAILLLLCSSKASPACPCM